MGAKPVPKFTDETSADSSSATAVTQGLGVPSNLDVILELGTVLGGRYEILEMLGIGGMGAVYKAHDRELDRTIALKVVRPDLARNPEILQRFKQELLTARQVSHRNVIRIFDLAEADGIKFITMEYVAGHDVRRLLADHGKLPPDEAINIIQQVCAGVAAAHAEGVIHRDLKPGNIMRDAQGRVVVMDFGLARTVTGDGMTKTGAMLGTVEYMSPEQAKAEKLDARSDLFTIGLILYELLTGKTPYKADSAIASLLKRTQEAAIPAHQVDPDVPRALSDILSKALERDPSQRYQTVQEFIDRLDEYQGKRPPSGIRVAPAFTRKRWMLIGIAAVLVLVIAVGARLWFTRSRTTPAGPHAPVSVLVADFTNHTGDPVFDGTLESMFNVALEGASFINAYNRGDARKLAQKLPNPTDKLDEQSARLIAVSQGLGAVVTGSLSLRGDGYKLSVEALDAVTGHSIANAEMSVANKDKVLLAISQVAAPIRKALGDSTPESVKLTQAETFTSGSLEAAHEYAQAQDLRYAGKSNDAIKLFLLAIQLDPNFGSAYAGLAAMYANQGHREEATRYYKMAMEHIDRMTDREKYRTRGGYYLAVMNAEKAIEEFSNLVKHYPADSMGLSSLAFAYYLRQDMLHAIEEAKKALEIYPKNVPYRNNLALYALYAGDFDTAAREGQAALELNPTYLKAYISVALSQLAQGHPDKAVETYQKLRAVSPLGASFASNGLADLALYQSRPSEAISVLQNGIADDLASKNESAAAKKYEMLAEAQLMLGQKVQAVSSADRAVALKKEAVLFSAARLYVELGQDARAKGLASALEQQFEPVSQAYAKLVEGDILLAHNRAQDALKLFQEARKISDTWLGRFDTARAYLEKGAFTEADTELDTCLKRQGESTDVYWDEVETFHFYPAVYYYLGRVREGLKSRGATDAYRTFLTMKVKDSPDPMVLDARKRLGSN